MLTGPTALYRFYDSSDQLLYVGITSDLDRRWREHSKQQAWWPDVYRSTVEWHEERYDAEEAEKAAIRAEEPEYNVMYGPASHAAITPRPPTLEQLRALYEDLVDLCPEGHSMYPGVQRLRRIVSKELDPRAVRDFCWIVNEKRRHLRAEQWKAEGWTDWDWELRQWPDMP